MAWELTGNSGTNPATNFLGTTDNEPLVIRTNGAERLHIDSTGNVGIGTTRPGTGTEGRGGDGFGNTVLDLVSTGRPVLGIKSDSA